MAGSGMSVIEAASHTSRVLVDGTLVLQVHIEPRFRDQAMSLFGAPGTAMALAALKVHETDADYAALAEAGRSLLQPKQRERMGPLCEWAVYRCKEPQFQQWIRPVYDETMGGDGTGWGDVTPDEDFSGSLEGYAAHAVKVICDVESRRELDREKKAAVFKRAVMQPYAAWLKMQEATA